MNQQRVLTVGLSGSDVSALHTQLAKLGYELPAEETATAHFGASTQAAVEEFQATQGLQTTGSVDEPTSTAMSTVVANSTYTVTGTVSSPGRAGVGKLTVALVDKNVGGDHTLTTTQTASDGGFSISLPIPPSYLKQRHKTKPDLQARALSGERPVGASLVKYGAPTRLQLDIQLAATTQGLPSEYETMAATLQAIYPGRLSALQESADQQDVSFLANRAGWDARLVALAAQAGQLSESIHAAVSGIRPGTAESMVAPGTPVPIRPEFCYALFRAGLPANPDALSRTSAGTVQAIWKQAISQGVIPQALEAEAPAALNAFVTWSAGHSLTAAPSMGVSTLQKMLASTLTNDSQQQQFSELATQYRDNWSGFWPAVEKAFPAQVGQLQFLGQLYFLTANNQPLVEALLRAEQRDGIKSTQDLAARGYYEADKWLPLIGTSIPSGTPGSASEQSANYAELLAAQVRVAHPTAVLADQVRRGIIPTSTPTSASGVAQFLTANQSQFVIGVEPVEAYIARNNITNTPAEVLGEIKRLQRTYQLTTDDAALGLLLNHNLDSAFAITRYDATGFERAFSGQLGGADKARAIHARARQIAGATINILATYAVGQVAPNLGGRSPIKYGNAPASVPPGYPVAAYATLEDLFGSLDYCNCSDCGSILSPAAYLVNLFHHVDQPSPSAGFQNPQDVLFQRRPDLQYLPLTCPNTNTALPYIDIVNETLEYFVANGLSIADYQGHDTSSTITSAELLASPQYVNDSAYTALQGAFFPPPLPFNRPLESLRLQLQNLGIALPDAMIAFRAGEQLTNTATPSSYGWFDILIEQLGISRDECRIFTDSTLQLGDLYGLPNATALATLQTSSLQEFSRRVGVSYADIVAILLTEFINPDAVLIPRLQRLNAPFSTLRVLHDNLGTPQSIANDFIAALPAGLDATEYGGTSPTDYAAVVSWVTGAQIYPRIMDLITISNPTGSADDCSGAALQLRYSSPDNTKNLLSGTDFLKLIRFIRLWQKLTPLLGDDRHATTIAQIDAMLTALYPQADEPVNPSSTANDGTNRPLLDAGFNAFLARAGYFFQVLNRLSLSAKRSLEQLLACWAPIGTVGANALYKRMFLTPTLLRQDPGAQTATVSSAVNIGDVLSTWVAGVAIPPYTVVAGDTAASVASAIANSINATMTLASGVALNERFFASSNGSVITIKAGFTLACAVSAGASETLTAAKTSSILRTATVAGTATAGDVLTTTLDGIAVSYTVTVGDTPATIAKAIAAAVNSTTAQDPLSGLPLNSLVVASSSGVVVTFIAANAGAPFALRCAFAPASAGTYTAGAPAAAGYKATITGVVAAGDRLVTTINSVPINYSALATDNNTTALAASIATAINTAIGKDPASLLPIGSLVHATSAANIVTINPIDPSTAFTFSCSVTAGAEGFAAAGPFPASQTATVAGGFPAGSVLTTTINGLNLYYTVVSGDTPSSIAGKVAASVNATTTPDPVSNAPLNTIVSATAAGAVVTFKAQSATIQFTLDVSVTAGAYTAGRLLPPFDDNGYGDFLADATQTLFGHEPLLCAAFNLTGAEFTLISTALQFDASTALTLPNVSAVYRYGWLAHTLGLSVLEFLRLREFSGLDPFAALDPGATAPVEPPVIRFVRFLQAMKAAGVQPVQALYLMWNQDISGKATPPAADVTALAFALRADFAAVEAQFTLQDDPSGTIAQGLMTLVYGATATDFFFGLLNNTFSTSVAYSNPAGPPALAANLLNASNGHLSYDDLSKQLSFAGYLDPATATALTAAATLNTTDNTDNVSAGSNVVFTPASMSNIAVGSVLVIDSGAAREAVAVTATTATTFTATTANAHNGTMTAFAIVSEPSLASALARLAAASTQAVGPFFATYPELQPLYTAYVASSDPVQTRRATLLSNFLPTLKRARKQEQALAEITASVGSDPSFATALLQSPAIVHADSDPTLAAVTDLTAIENPGLSAQFFLSNDSSLPPDRTSDFVAPLSYAQTATVGGTITVGDTLTTSINGVAIPYKVTAADTSLAILAANLGSTINAQTAIDPVSSLPMNQAVLASSNSSTVIIRGQAPTGASDSFTLACAVSPGASEAYAAGSQLPPGGGGGAIAASWRGYLSVPQNGFYNLVIATDPGASVTLNIGGNQVVLAATAGLWRNQSPVSLAAGALIPISLTATSIKTNLSLRWQTLGIGWQVVPQHYLYPLTLIDRLANTYTRFLMAASLASALSLTANEMAYLDTSPSYVVSTTSATTAAAGPTLFTPASMSNIGVGSVLVIDSGNAQESVTITGVTATTFSATTTHAHDGSTTPFLIVDRTAADIGRGWLNFLGIPQDPAHPDPVTAAKLSVVLSTLLDYARIKQAVSAGDERLLAVLKSPAAVLPGGLSSLPSPSTPVPASQSALLALTGWALDSLNALLTQFFGNIGAGSLSDINNLRRVYDAYAIVRTCRVTATTLVAGITNAPSAGSVNALQSALRALYAEADWLTAVKPLNDTLRISQRDALVAYTLQKLGDRFQQLLINSTTSAPASTASKTLTVGSAAGLSVGMGVMGVDIAPGTTVTAIAGNTVTLSTGVLSALPTAWGLTFVPANASAINTPNDLFQYFLIDPETQPPVETSRIRLALSAVQLFIERIVRNLEPEIAPGDIDPVRWQWMKRYRVWQANIEVFLWPENWLYPELRDDQSPIFQQMMSSLLQSDITDDAAENAYLDYLSGLEAVAKLEPCGMYYQPGTADTDEATYVVSRTAGAHRKYFFRQLQYGSWTPWTEVKIDCEDMPLTPVVWNGRLFLFWLKSTKQSPVQTAPDPNSDQSSLSLTDSQTTIGNLLGAGPSTTASATYTNVQAILCWTEYYNGKWQPPKTSDVTKPTDIGRFSPSGADAFDANRNLIRLVPTQYTGQVYTSFGATAGTVDLEGALLLAIVLPPNSGSLMVPGFVYTPGFALYNTHSLPVRFEDVMVPWSDSTFQAIAPLSDSLDIPEPARGLGPLQTYTGGTGTGEFVIDYYPAKTSSLWDEVPSLSNDLFTFNRVPRFVDSQPYLANAGDAPFFYEDRRYLFYVRPAEDYVTLPTFRGFGVDLGSYRPSRAAYTIPNVVIRETPFERPPRGDPVDSLATGGGAPVDNAALQSYLAAQNPNIKVSIGSRTLVTYQGQRITPAGSLLAANAIRQSAAVEKRS